MTQVPRGAVTCIKVCGLTRDGDVRLAAGCGAWALGFVLTDSPRRVPPERARELAAAAGTALTVGVFTTESADAVAQMLETSGLGAAQLSAGADGPTVAAVRAAAASRGLRPLVIAAADTADAADADLVLLDARTTGAYGGTGRTLDWAALAASSATPAPARVVLAGGLTPENAGAAIAALRPLALDVSSGVESAPGVKDEARLREFFAAVEQADKEGVAGAAAARERTP